MQARQAKATGMRSMSTSRHPSKTPMLASCSHRSPRASHSPPPAYLHDALFGRLEAPRPSPGFEQVDWAYHQQIVDLVVAGLRAAANRRRQAVVLAQIPPGGRVRSPNAKVTQIGLIPDTLFPPMRLDMIYAIPGHLMRFASIAAGAPVPPGLPL